MLRLLVLRIYRYHSAACRKELGVKYKKLKPSMQRRAVREYNACECAIWMTGSTDTAIYPRYATGLRDWIAAEALKRSMEAGAKDTAVHGPTIAHCIEEFLAAHAEHVSARPLAQYKHVLNLVQEFAHGRNKHFMQELNVDLLESFKTHALAGLKSTSKSNSVQKLKKFLSVAYTRGWTTAALALQVKSTKAVYEKKKPFSEEEIPLLMAEAEKLNGGTVGYATHGRTFELLLEFMLQTGLRVSDAVRFNPALCAKTPKQWLYTFEPVKQTRESLKKYITAYLSLELKSAIDKAEWFSKTLPFAYHSPDKSERADLEQAVYERMQNIGERCEGADCRPHRLRHTFAVRKLGKGVSMGDLSEMLGHSSVTITQKYYSFWDPRRNDRLALVALKSRTKS